MAYDDIIDPKQGAIKSSEIYLDRSLDIIKNSIGETVLKTLEGMMKPISDAIRFNNFLLYSDGQIAWETVSSQPRIRFNADAKANNIRLRLMMLDETATSRTVDLIIPATTGANSLTAFNIINMNNNDLIYMELSRSVILAALSGTPASTPATIILENGIDGGSVTSGKRLLKVNMTGNTGMPAMVADLDSLLQDSSQTVNIPIASRYDWTDGISSYSDIWWIPHGIRWPTGSISVIGAVLVSGFSALPNYFSRTITEFNQHLALLTTTGGMIAIIAPITINSPITIPAGVTIIGRTTKNDNASPGLYFASGGRFIMGARSKVKDLYIRGLSDFGQVVAENIIEISGAGVEISGNFFEFVSNLSTQARAINLFAGAQDFLISKNTFSSISASTVGVFYSAASYLRAQLAYNSFTTITESTYVTRAAALNTNNSYGIVPIGTILPWMGSAFTNAANGSPSSIAASYTALATMLPEGWIICDGRALPTGSPLILGGATFTPNLTNVFVYGVNSLSSGSVGGASSAALSVANLPSHQHTIAHGHSATTTASGSIVSDQHSHGFNHVHQWGWKTGSTGAGSEGLYTYTDNSHTNTPSFNNIGTIPVIVNATGGTSGRFGGAAAGGKDDGTFTTDGAWYTGAANNSPIVTNGVPAGVGVGNSYTGSAKATNGAALPANPVSFSTTVVDSSDSSGFTGSGSAFSILPSYITAIYIMRYK